MAVIKAFAQDAADRAEPLTVAAAYAQCRDAALAESAIGVIGLEIESHLVDLDHVADRVPWRRVESIAAVVGRVAPGTAVTVEPGGQIELSGPPEAGVGPAVARLRYEGAGARLALAERRLGLAFAGADPARPSRRVNPRPRYRAMEQHFAATGWTAAGRVMMNSTAALQVNLQAGPSGEWPARVARAYRLGPTLVAIAASSPWLHGRDTGWKSVRQRAWSGLDARTCGPVPGCAPKDGRDEALDPASAWARFAMRAPVTFVRAGDDVLNADGWGAGFYAGGPAGARALAVEPAAVDDASFASVAPVIASPCVLAAVRSATAGMPADETAAAPFAVRPVAAVPQRRRRPGRCSARTRHAESACDSALLAAHLFDFGPERAGEFAVTWAGATRTPG